MKRFLLLLMLLLPVTAFGAPSLIIDHTSVDLFDSIPAYWISQVKQLTFQYQGGSHARQMEMGMVYLDNGTYQQHENVTLDGTNTYAFEFREEGDGDYAFAVDGTLNQIEDGGYEGSAPYQYFVDAGAIADLKARILEAKTDGFQPIVSLLGWSYNFCSNSASFGGAYSDAIIDDYTDALVTLNADVDLDGTTFVYHTSIMEANCNDQTYAQRELWNQRIRDAASTAGGILFDQALMEVWNSDNTEYRDDPDVRAHTDYQTGTAPDTCPTLCDEEHANDLIGIRKAKAMWVMLAILAGWNGEADVTTTITGFTLKGVTFN